MDSLGASSKKRSVDSCACDLGRKQKKKHKRHKGHYEESELTPSSSSESDIYKAKSRKKKAHKKKKKHHKTEKGHESIVVATTSAAAVTSSTIADISKLKATIAAQSAKPRGPMTKEEYERQQSVVRRVYDPDTGRHRLVKGDGEIIEEIVSRDRQKAINKQATIGDGLSFQAQMKKLL